MRYKVLFDSTASEDESRGVVRMLEALPLIVVPAAEATRGEVCVHPCVPVITFGTDPDRFDSLGRLGPRGWVAILPERGGSPAAFMAAGAFAALRLPLERSALLSTIPRCLAGAGAASSPLPARIARAIPRDTTRVTA